MTERDVEATAVSREQWAVRFESKGMATGRTGPRITMRDSINSGWVDFAGGAAEHLQGDVPLPAWA